MHSTRRGLIWSAHLVVLHTGVADLQARLRSKGSDLLVLHGLPEQEIPRLARRVGASTVYCHM